MKLGWWVWCIRKWPYDALRQRIG